MDVRIIPAMSTKLSNGDTLAEPWKSIVPATDTVTVWIANERQPENGKVLYPAVKVSAVLVRDANGDGLVDTDGMLHLDSRELPRKGTPGYSTELIRFLFGTILSEIRGILQ